MAELAIVSGIPNINIRSNFKSSKKTRVEKTKNITDLKLLKEKVRLQINKIIIGNNASDAFTGP